MKRQPNHVPAVLNHFFTSWSQAILDNTSISPLATKRPPRRALQTTQPAPAC
ncbi:hypothetical protein PGTUg99_037391 [Puccinia graminis f. sp. tritici]|uniref:Uncharacterized protein n=1 Tax=Puccinia graminis f. sp. tritici TaxID=56615 RepID=A0A5B0S2K4_PUCGR|nr:hypothetical protein PGTUg99_037391 [Puccinia graminis f. sp. tritici]